MELLQEYFSTVEWQDIVSATLRILLIATLGWILTLIARSGLRRFERRLIARGHRDGDLASEAAKRAETLVRLLRQGVLILIWAVAILVVLNELGVSVGPILASAGVAGLAIGFGAQNLVRDVISGFFLIIEDQVRLGDVAVVNGTGGLVEAINFRTLILRDLAGTVHVFPNGSITTLANLTKGWSGYVFEIGVAYRENTDRVVATLRGVAEELHQDESFGRLMIEPVEIFGVEKFADSSVVIKGRIKTHPIRQWEVGREFLRRVKLAFDREGIEIPYPHRVMQFDPTSPPLTAQLLGEGARDSAR